MDEKKELASGDSTGEGCLLAWMAAMAAVATVRCLWPIMYRGKHTRQVIKVSKIVEFWSEILALYRSIVFKLICFIRKP